MAESAGTEGAPRLVGTSVQVPPEMLGDADGEAQERQVSRSDVLRLWLRLGRAEVERLKAEGRWVA